MEMHLLKISRYFWISPAKQFINSISQASLEFFEKILKILLFFIDIFLSEINKIFFNN
jgi:hypothetical protein